MEINKIILSDENEEAREEIDVQLITDNYDEILMFTFRQWLSHLNCIDDDVSGGICIYETSEELHKDYTKLIDTINTTRESIKSKCNSLYNSLKEHIIEQRFFNDILSGSTNSMELWKDSNLILYLYGKYINSEDNARYNVNGISDDELGEITDDSELLNPKYLMPTCSLEYILYYAILELQIMYSHKNIINN